MEKQNEIGENVKLRLLIPGFLQTNLIWIEGKIIDFSDDNPIIFYLHPTKNEYKTNVFNKGGEYETKTD